MKQFTYAIQMHMVVKDVPVVKTANNNKTFNVVSPNFADAHKKAQKKLKTLDEGSFIISIHVMGEVEDL